jgi:hypothetical protein
MPHDTLPDKDKRVKHTKHLEGFGVNVEGMKTFVQDCSIDRGLILACADGVWSKTTQLAAERALQSGIEAMPYKTGHEVVYGMCRPLRQLKGDTTVLIQHARRTDDEAVILTLHRDRSFFALFNKTGESREELHFSQADADNVLET